MANRMHKLQEEQRAAIADWQQARADLAQVIAAGGKGKTQRIKYYQQLERAAHARMIAADEAVDQARAEQGRRSGDNVRLAAYSLAMAATVSPC